MQLISLNTWGGKIYKPLINFLQKHSKDTDIFCFQEVFQTNSDIKVMYERRMNLFADLSQVLTNHQGYYCPTIKNYVIFSRSNVYHTDFNLYFGLAIFVKKDIQVQDHGDFNLDINTRSIEILEENLINLIKKYNIKSTRNKHFPGQEKFADYMFVSQGVNVLNFKVPDLEISDHLPMILEFS